MKADQFKMNTEEKFIFQKMRELFLQLRGLSREERKLIENFSNSLVIFSVKLRSDSEPIIIIAFINIPLNLKLVVHELTNYSQEI